MQVDDSSSHNPKIVGSNPTPATREIKADEKSSAFFRAWKFPARRRRAARVPPGSSGSGQGDALSCRGGRCLDLPPQDVPGNDVGFALVRQVRHAQGLNVMPLLAEFQDSGRRMQHVQLAPRLKRGDASGPQDVQEALALRVKGVGGFVDLDSCGGAVGEGSRVMGHVTFSWWFLGPRKCGPGVRQEKWTKFQEKKKDQDEDPGSGNLLGVFGSLFAFGEGEDFGDLDAFVCFSEKKMEIRLFKVVRPQ